MGDSPLLGFENHSFYENYYSYCKEPKKLAQATVNLLKIAKYKYSWILKIWPTFTILKISGWQQTNSSWFCIYSIINI